MVFLTSKDKKQKKIERAKKFGLEIPELKEEKKRQRQERFGVNTTGTALTDNTTKRAERLNRFGVPTKPQAANPKRDQRLQRFGVATSTVQQPTSFGSSGSYHHFVV